MNLTLSKAWSMKMHNVFHSFIILFQWLLVEALAFMLLVLPQLPDTCIMEAASMASKFEKEVHAHVLVWSEARSSIHNATIEDQSEIDELLNEGNSNKASEALGRSSYLYLDNYCPYISTSITTIALGQNNSKRGHCYDTWRFLCCSIYKKKCQKWVNKLINKASLFKEVTREFSWIKLL